jgi:hypothetical protein
MPTGLSAGHGNLVGSSLGDSLIIPSAQKQNQKRLCFQKGFDSGGDKVCGMFASLPSTWDSWADWQFAIPGRSRLSSFRRLRRGRFILENLPPSRPTGCLEFVRR